MSAERVLFLAPSFLSRRAHKPIRGVEIFDLLLVRQMSELGLRVCVPAERFWRDIFRERFAGTRIEAIFVPGPRRCGIPSLLSAMLLRRRKFDVIILGNNARGLLWGLRVLRPKRSGARVLLIAHRAAQEQFLPALARYNIDVVAVSDAVARTFHVEGRGARRLETYYGIPDAERFSPRRARGAGDGIVRFGVLGKLDDPWKGADVAIEAFGAMPDQVRSRCELHLAGFVRPPRGLPSGVRAHAWLSREQTPEYLRSLDVYLACSTGQETFGQSVVQAMLAGLPVIATPLEVHAEKLDAGGGVVAADARAMGEAMTRLAQDESLRRAMGESARRTALLRYVWSTREFVERFIRRKDA